jgi:serine/threonine-protein kinase
VSLTPGARLGAYEVVARIGAGGMGEVYRARDTKLNRDVALKVLPELFTQDPDRLARFKREAQVLASLNHPNIAGIHGLEEADGMRALVLELVEGPTLADRIAQGAIPVDEALPIARQIAEGLEAAHEHGIIHRDLKPSNIKLRPDGTVKVLDFGLAKVLAGEHADVDLSQIPTFTVAGTREGLILGTPAYMSPEQTRGQAIDRRTDIWAFGCVLYELLTGRAAFGRKTMSDTIAAILECEPDWTALPATTPSAIGRLLRRCFEKNPKHRLHDIADARIELEDALATRVPGARVVQRPSRWRQTQPWALAAVLVISMGIGGATLAWRLSRSGGDASRSVIRTTVPLPAGQQLESGRGAASLALSPDGKRLAYVAYLQGSTRLYLRNLDAFEPQPIPDTAGAQYPFFSPDGQSVAFFSDKKLKRVSISGGAPVVVCDAPVIGRGGTWGPDGTVVFDAGPSGLMRVASRGGIPEAVPVGNAAADSRDNAWPRFLPDGRGVLVTRAGSRLGVVSLKSGEWRALGPGSQAQYLPSGHLLFHAIHVRDGELHVVPFDPVELTIRGAPVAVFDGVFRAPNAGAAYFAVSDTGTLVFAPGGLAHSLVRVDRTGRRTPVTADRRGFRFPRLSPDGSKVAVTIDPRPSEIWVYDLVRGSSGPLAVDGHNLHPVWTRDGRRVAYAARGDIYWRDADGRSLEERLLTRDLWQYPQAWSPDGSSLFYNEDHPASGMNIWVLPLGGEPRPVLVTPDREEYPTVSPDARWLAYQSNESGRFEVYVRPLPDVNQGRWTISTAGGHSPVWSRDGQELFYMDGTAMMTVPVDARGAVFVAGTPKLLFDGPFDPTQLGNYDVSADGTRFVMVHADPDATPNRFNIVQNWFEELKRLVPTK